MSWLTEERQAVADLIATTDAPALLFPPARVSPPFSLVLPGSPYLEKSDRFGEKLLRLDLWLVAGEGDTAALSDALDNEIVRVADLLDGDEITIEQVDQPIEWRPASGAVYYVTILSARLPVQPPSNLNP